MASPGKRHPMYVTIRKVITKHTILLPGKQGRHGYHTRRYCQTFPTLHGKAGVLEYPVNAFTLNS